MFFSIKVLYLFEPIALYYSINAGWLLAQRETKASPCFNKLNGCVSFYYKPKIVKV